MADIGPQFTGAGAGLTCRRFADHGSCGRGRPGCRNWPQCDWACAEEAANLAMASLPWNSSGLEPRIDHSRWRESMRNLAVKVDDPGSPSRRSLIAQQAIGKFCGLMSKQ